MSKYRISRRQKKLEKNNLLFLTDRDMKTVGPGLTKRERRSLKFQVWTMAGLIYHQYNFIK